MLNCVFEIANLVISYTKYVYLLQGCDIDFYSYTNHIAYKNSLQTNIVVWAAEVLPHKFFHIFTKCDTHATQMETGSKERKKEHERKRIVTAEIHSTKPI